MKKLDEKILITGSRHGFFMNAKQISEMHGCSTRHVRNMIDGIKAQIQKGRYSRYAIIDSGETRVNIYVYYDYDKYRRLLNDANASKVVPDFNPAELAAICPMVERVIAVDMEDR